MTLCLLQLRRAFWRWFEVEALCFVVVGKRPYDFSVKAGEELRREETYVWWEKEEMMTEGYRRDIGNIGFVPLHGVGG